MRMLRFDWSVYLVKNLADWCLKCGSIRTLSVEMTTAEHYMHLKKFFELLPWQCCSFGELKFVLGTHTFV